MLVYTQGRIEALSGTVRYDLPDDLRRELSDLGKYINMVTKIDRPIKSFDMFVKPLPAWVQEDIEKDLKEEANQIGRRAKVSKYLDARKKR